jgi:hypothetical protein
MAYCRAMAVAAARGCVLNVLLILLAPALLGGGMVWLASVLGELLTIAISIALIRQSKGRRNPDSVVMTPSTQSILKTWI